MTLTVVDKTKPKPLYNCSACGKPIEIGTPYKHISPKSGPYGGHKMTRHESCPSWQVWDYSNSLSAQLSRISYDFGNEIDQAESPDDVTSALTTRPPSPSRRSPSRSARARRTSSPASVTRPPSPRNWRRWPTPWSPGPTRSSPLTFRR